MIVAIDGTVSSGKSTAAKGLARELGFLHINTGLMYRAVAAACLSAGVDTANKPAAASLASTLKIDLVEGPDGQHALVNGEDVTAVAKSSAVSSAVSDIADNVEVRKRLVAEQRRLGLEARPGAVLEGRDIGSVVFPDAEIKFFVTADLSVRAHRRYLEFTKKGEEISEETVLWQVMERDRRDRERPVGALVQLPDAITIDTSNLTPREVVLEMAEYVRNKEGFGEGLDLSFKIGPATFKNPIWTASGTCGNGEEFEGLADISKLGALVMKGTTLNPRDGNPFSRIVETPSGILNCIGLQNPGIKEVLEKKAPYLSEKGVSAILNISGSSAEEYGYMAAMAEASPHITAVEMNVSCPNVKEGGITFGTDPKVLGRAVKCARENLVMKPLIVKLSPNVTDITVMAKVCEAQGADAVSLINTLTGLVINTKTRRPVLGNITGGLSGPAVRPIAVRMVWQVAKAVKIPVIGLGGIECLDDALQFFIAGATAVQVGTANFYDPNFAPRLVGELENYLRKNKLSSVRELRGDF